VIFSALFFTVKNNSRKNLSYQGSWFFLHFFRLFFDWAGCKSNYFRLYLRHKFENISRADGCISNFSWTRFLVGISTRVGKFTAHLSWVELGKNSTQLKGLSCGPAQLNSTHAFLPQLNSTQLTFFLPTQLNSTHFFRPNSTQLSSTHFFVSCGSLIHISSCLVNLDMN